MKEASPEYKVIKNCDIYTPEKIIKNGFIMIQGEKIATVGQLKDARWPEGAKIFNFKGQMAFPGFIDIHVHGGHGADFMDASPESISEALQFHLKNGTTSILPTLMTASHKHILQTIEAIHRIKSSSLEIPEILGLNLEGPYISREKCGAQPKRYIRKPSLGEMKEYIEASQKTIKITTLAPENEGAIDFINYLVEQEIIPAAGHSNANYSQAVQAIEAGIRHATHLFNAMRGIFHRDPGVSGALLMDDKISVEIIADSRHLHPGIIQMIAELKPLRKIILISDATRFTGLRQEAILTREGILYGSTMPLNLALKNLVQFTSLPLQELLKTVTLNPARLLNISAKKGKISRGNDADIVILDKNFNVKAVFRKGFPI